MLEGDVSELSSETIRALRETVENELKSKNYRVVISSASKAGTNNFMGTVFRATFSKQDEANKENNPEHKMIVKVAPMQVSRREQFTARPSFLQEMYMYGTVSIYQFENKAIMDIVPFELPELYLHRLRAIQNVLSIVLLTKYQSSYRASVFLLRNS